MFVRHDSRSQRVERSTQIAIMTVLLAAVIGLTAIDGRASQFTLPGVIPPSACRVGAVLSGEQFTTTGFSNVRTAHPDGEYVAGFWVVANDYVENTSVVGSPNCETAYLGQPYDNHDLNLMGVRLKPTMASAREADIREVKLVHDVNLNGQYEPLLDQVLQIRPGSDLDTQNSAIYAYGPQAPLALLGSASGGMAADVSGRRCQIGRVSNGDQEPRPEQGAVISNNCAMGLLAVVTVGDSPTTGSQFGLELEALAGDIPGATGGNILATNESSGFSSSRNPQASNVRLQMVGGQPGSATPISHISNGSGNPESAVRAINFTGGQAGEGLLTRFRAPVITAGTREAIAVAVGICDGAELANTNASILPSIAGSTPQIAGGPAALPCVDSDNIDNLATGINGATLIFSGPLAQYMGTVRMYVDTCGQTADANVGCEAGQAYSDFGGGNGILFEPGELADQTVPTYNEATGEAIAVFGGRQEQVLTVQYDGQNVPVAVGNDQNGGGEDDNPLLIIFTVDIDENAPSGQVDVELGLHGFDDTAQERSGATNPCSVMGAHGFGTTYVTDEACGSNFLNEGPATSSFSVEAADGGGGQPSGVAQYDTNNSGVIDDSEFMVAIDDWIGGSIGDALFFDVLDAWVDQTSVSTAGVSGLSLSSVNLSSSANGTTFAVSGQGVESTSVEVFSLDGSQVFAQTSAGSTLTWNHTASSGQSVANGVYLYRVTVEGADGGTVTSRVGKLVVVR